VAAFNLSPYFAVKNLDTTGNEKDAKNQAEIKDNVARLRQIVADTMEALHPKAEAFGGMMGGEPQRRIDFYPDANLLIVIGSDEDLEAAQVVIGALPGMEGMRFSVQRNLTRFRGAQDTTGRIAPTPPAAPVPPQNPALPVAPVPPQNPSP
jgi:hypothetical protein